MAGQLAALNDASKTLEDRKRKASMMLLQPYTRIKDDEKASAWWSETNYREGKVQNGLESQENFTISALSWVSAP
jgi:hypothetical protein